jgi:hypothetical protein
MFRTAYLALGLAPAMACVASPPAQAVAHVLDVKGDWRLDGGGTPVTSGQGLTPGARVLAASRKLGDAITILHDEDMSRVHVDCDGSSSGSCGTPIVVQGNVSTVAGQSQFKNMVQAALSILLSKPPAINNSYALTMTRGMRPPRLSEAVIALDPKQGIVLPAAEDMAAGTYSISIRRAGEKTPAKVLSGQLTTEGVWRPLPWDSTGVFDISIDDSGGKRIAAMTALVTPADRYPAVQADFDAMKARTADWSGPNARSDERLFLRAFLLSENQP